MFLSIKTMQNNSRETNFKLDYFHYQKPQRNRQTVTKK